MRIISGKLKGRKINFLKNLATRPLKDSVKENIFNILKHSNLFSVKVGSASVLDLYSGIGSFGIECISREAKKVDFVEKDKAAFDILKRNLEHLSIIDQTTVFNNETKKFLEINKKNKYSIFFLDPPFADKNFIQVLNLIKKNKIFKTKHIVIIHRELKTDDDLSDFLDTIIVKQYGRSKIIFGVFN